MNLADSMRSQDNINKMEKIKEDGEEYNLLPMDKMTDISVRNKINKLPEKKKTELCKFR